MNIKLYKNRLPRIDTLQMVEVDRLMIEEYGIQLIQMMENAGRCLAILARDRFLEQDVRAKEVVILAGAGGNGGGALAAARRLHNWGAQVQVYTTADEEQMKQVPGQQLQILKRMGIPILDTDSVLKIAPPDLIIDGIIGYSLHGDPQGNAKKMIDWANAKRSATLSLDTPSGLDLTTGHIHDPTIKARATLTLALPKKGLFSEDVLSYRGELYLGDISVPPELYSAPSLGIEIGNIFFESDVLRID